MYDQYSQGHDGLPVEARPAVPLQHDAIPQRAGPPHNRRSIRLRRYDYTRAGAYFLTICARNRECLFGGIIDGEMRLNELGRIVADEWIKTGDIRKAIQLDEWVVMPNHFHCIAVVTDDHRDTTHCRRGTARRAPTVEQFSRPVAGSIPTIIRSFKSAVTRHINDLHSTPGTKLWQRNYWEHVIRNESELNRIREYIQNNPAHWEQDRLYKRPPPYP